MVTHKIVAYLFTLALGYWVLTHAEKQAGLTQKIGKVIGWIILIVSLCGPLCMLGSHMMGCCKMDHCCSMSSCPSEQGGMMGGCPMGMMGGEDKQAQPTPAAKAKK